MHTQRGSTLNDVSLALPPLRLRQGVVLIDRKGLRCEKKRPWKTSVFDLSDTVDGRNPIIHRVFYIPGGAGFFHQQ